jgi:diguanylate cyclase (GGDEF)-like protein
VREVGPVTEVERGSARTNILIVVLSALLFCAGAAIWVLLPGASLLGHRHITFVNVTGLLVAFCVSEVFVAGVAARTGSHTFSPSDLALAVGILVVPPRAVAFCSVVGLGVALVFRLRGAVLRLGFNVGQTAFSATAGVFLASAISGGPSEPSSRVWISALAGVTTSAILGSLAVDAAVTINDGRAHFGAFGRSLVFSGAAAVGLGSLGVLVVWASKIDTTVLALVVPPMGITFFALRASLQQRQQREEVEFLYRALRALSDERDIARGLVTIAESLRNTLRAKEVVIRLHANGIWHVLNEAQLRLDAGHDVPKLPGQSLRCESDYERNVLRRRIDGADRVLALIEVRSKLLGRKGFDRNDQHHVDQLADQLAVHLENSGLSHSLDQLERAEQLLRNQLETDHLTGLANRAWLHKNSEDAAPWAVVLIDLDGFKAVNDTLGHEAGDRVLAGVGQKLRDIIPQGWTAVRLGGDEFAVVKYGDTKPERREVEDLVALIEERCVDRTLVRDADVRVGASAGAALRSRPSDDLDELLRRADSAMYAAKRARKNRISDAPEEETFGEPVPFRVFHGGAS